MTLHISRFLITATLLACTTSVSSVLAQKLPYNPSYLIKGQNSRVYQFSPEASPQFAFYDVRDKLNNDDAPATLSAQLPFLTNASASFIPVITRNGLTVFSGECSEGEQELDLWTYGFGANNQTWTQVHITSTDQGLSANFLAAAFAFPNLERHGSDDMYVFGGMCPNNTSNATAWTSSAAYSNTLLAISPDQGNDYDVSLTGTRSPPIAEAGLSITPLKPTTFQEENIATQQNFILLGGHTQNAFINMSQVAMFSMPEQAWAFIGINQPANTVVEPRSGHTAVISEDGTKIFIFGGWVGSITNPATPQLVVLEVGQGYGGNGSWAWTVPDVSGQYASGANGVYGHAAVMLPGDIMMVTGGYSITGGGSKVKRAALNTMFYDTNAASWSQSYTNPNAKADTGAASSGLSSKGKTGLGAGLGIGLAAVAVIAILGLLHMRRKRQRRRIREQRLRELALGANDAFSTAEIPRPGGRGILPGYRSASWGARQEEQIEGAGGQIQSKPDNDHTSNHDDYWNTARNGMLNVAGANRNMQNGLKSRGPPSLGSQWHNGSPAAGGVFTIEEVEERSEPGPASLQKSAESRPPSDPFKDPSQNITDEAAQRRRQEVQTWVEDWQSAAESMNMSRSPSKAHSKTYSNLSTYHSGSSGDKSDRTNSDLSERSNYSNLSIQRSAVGSIARTTSQSSKAGYALFSSAAAAMGRLAGRQDASLIERSASKRVVSTGDLAQMAARKRSNSVEQHNRQPMLETVRSREDLNATGDYYTPPESPIKDYKQHVRKRSNSFGNHSNSFTSQSKRALDAFSYGAKRILTGTSNVSVSARVEAIEPQSRDSSPSKHSSTPDMTEVLPRRVSSSSAAFWRHKQGAKDWEDSGLDSSGTIRRRSSRQPPETADDDSSRHDDDWDIETAVQQRVVQVMFTVPKEKLRVVNADNLSMISRTDTNASRNSERSEDGKDVQRMSRVTEDGEEDSTIAGSVQLATTRLHPSSAAGAKGKERIANQAWSDASGQRIGEAF